MATDSFLQTSGGPQALNVYSANWQQVQGTFNIPNGTGDVRCTASGVDHLARYTAFTPGASQYAEVVPATGWAASGRYIGPAVRVSASGDAYSVQATGGDWVVGRMVSGAWTTIGTGTWTAVDGQPIRLEVTGVGATVTLVLKRNGTTVTTINDTNAARITAANSLGFGGYDAGGSDPGIADWSGDNLGGGSSELSGNATLDGSTADGGMSGASSLSGGATMGDVSAGGGIQGGSTLTGGADLGGVSAGGGLDAPNSLSGGATLDGPTAAGGASGGSTITGDAALDGPAAGGGMSSGATGTLTSSDLKFNNGAVHSNVPFEAFISVPSTGALVLRKTGLTSTTSGTAPKCSFADAALTPGTQYRVTWRRTDTGAEGTEILTAT